jgi:argininosuccinate lyase
MALWGGRFSEAGDQFFLKFNQSLSFDYKLFKSEIVASTAYAKELAKAGILNADEEARIVAALEGLGQKFNHDDMMTAIERGVEDVHSLVESELVKMVGDLGRKLHSGRSRNEQVATDLRIFLKEEIFNLKEAVTSLERQVIQQAEANLDAIMPGYTHLQRAQPIRWAHYLFSWIEGFERDKERLDDLMKRVDVMPLGSGAISGNVWGLDRERLRADLGFGAITRNSLDATSDRDFVVETMFCCSSVMLRLSRLAEDLILYTAKEFGFIELGDKVATGSSLMPQKKNPDSLELIRGKTGRVVGNLTALMMTVKGLPSCYNKDLQEDKEGLFDSLKQTLDCIQVMELVFGNMTPKPEVMLAACYQGYLNATELADYLVIKKLPFRHAHELVGKMVVFAIQQGKKLEDLSLAEFQSFFPDVENDVYTYLDVQKCVDRKTAVGGTAKSQVLAQLARYKKVLS